MNALTNLQERFESSDIGRMLISAFLIFTLLGIAVWNLPGGAAQSKPIPSFAHTFNPRDSTKGGASSRPTRDRRPTTFTPGSTTPTATRSFGGIRSAIRC